MKILVHIAANMSISDNTCAFANVSISDNTCVPKVSVTWVLKMIN